MNDMAHRLDDVSQSEHLGSRVNNLSILDALGIVRCFVAFLLSVTKGAQDVPVRGGWNANTIRATSYRSVVMKPGERVIEGVSVRALAALFKLVKSFHDRIERLLDRVQCGKTSSPIARRMLIRFARVIEILRRSVSLKLYQSVGE